MNVVGGSAAVLCGDDVYNRSFVLTGKDGKLLNTIKFTGFPMPMNRCISKAVIMRFPLHWMIFPAPWSFVMISAFPSLCAVLSWKGKRIYFCPCRLAEGASFPLDAFGTGKSGGKPGLPVCRQPGRNFRENGVRGKLGASRSLGE